MNLGEAGASEHSLLHLRDYGRVLSERRALVVTCLVLVVAFTAIFTFLATPLYRATTTIQIERQGPGVLSFSDMSGTDYYDYQDFYQTQYKILQSQTVLRLAAARLDLPNRPEYATRMGSPLSRWIETLRASVSSSEPWEPEDPLIAAGEFIGDGLAIEPVRNSKLVKITFIDRSRILSADCANAVAEAYEQFNTDTRFSTTKQAGEFLTKQVARLQTDIKAQERVLQQYANKNEILSISSGAQDISEKALGDLNAKFVDARGRLAVAQARHEAVAAGSPDSFPEVLASPLVLELKKQNAEVERRHSQMAERFKPDWPPLKQLQEELDGTKRRLDLETDAIARQVRSVAKAEYGKLQAEVANLARQVEAQKGEVQRVGRDAIEYASIKAEIETKRKMLTDILTRQSETETTSGLKDTRATNIRVVDRAEAPTGSFKPRKSLNLALSVVFGLGLGAAAAFLFNYLDNTVKSEQDIQRYAGIPALGFVPLYQPLRAVESDALVEEPSSQYQADLACHGDSRSSFAEAFKSLRTAFLLASPERPPRHVVVTSCEPLDGKSTVATNLAIALTQIGRRVVMVDADLRRPRLHKVLGVGNDTGLSSVLSGNADVADVLQETVVPNLVAITSGPVPPNPSELLASSALDALMRELEQLGPFDHVFFDSPPLLQMADAVLLADRMEATIVVAREGRTVNASLASGVKRLRQSRARILGAVLNAVVEKFGGYYYYRYRYGSSEGAKPSRVRGLGLSASRRARRRA